MNNSIVAVLLALSLPAFAQDEKAEADAPEAAEEASAPEPEAEPEPEAPKGPAREVEYRLEGEEGGSSEGQQGAPESYTVQPGDTLWTLSQRFLNNPWYWPKVWSYNPQVDNPNWIRPGTVIRFYPGSDQPIVMSKPDDAEEEIDDEFGDMEGGGFEKAADLQNYLDRLAGIDAGARRREFFVPSEKVDDAGSVMNSPDEKMLLADGDKAYLKLKSGNVGDTLQIFRKGREVKHPVTGARLGTVVEMVGETRVEKVGKDSALAAITVAWDPVERGDLVARLPTVTPAVSRVANSKAVKGYVVDTGQGFYSFFGESFVVIIDKGKNDGLTAGNTFSLVRAGDPYTHQNTGLIDEDIGEVIVTEVHGNVSTAMVLAANREILPGDRIEMRVP